MIVPSSASIKRRRQSELRHAVRIMDDRRKHIYRRPVRSAHDAVELRKELAMRLCRRWASHHRASVDSSEYDDVVLKKDTP